MDFIDFECAQDDNARRIDKIIKKILPETPLSLIYKDFRKGLIKLNNSKVKPETLVATGDIIKIASFLVNEKQESQKITGPLPPLIFENKHLWIFNKPCNMLVQKADKNDISLDDMVKQKFKEEDINHSLSFTPGPLHRLDRNTSGLICFSHSLEGAHWFSQNIQSHSIGKKYIGIVEGNLQTQEVWKDKISKDYDKEKSFQTVNITSSDDESNAFTIATPMKHGKYKNLDITVVEFEIKTGKTHQIRSQSAYHHFPLLGDTAYNAQKLNLSRPYFLHAYKLNFKADNPLNLPEQILCPLQKDMEDFILKTCE